MADIKYLRNVPLPQGLTGISILNAMNRTEATIQQINSIGIHLSELIQSNNFSGVVSNLFTKFLGENSDFLPFDDQRYPDLKNRETGMGLEVKATNKPFKGGEAHNGHSGWHIIICYKILDNYEIKFIQVEIAQLNGFERHDSDWKYLGSKRNSNNSQRTETYITTNIGTAKLRDGTVYFDTSELSISPSLMSGRKRVDLSIPDYSIFKSH